MTTQERADLIERIERGWMALQEHLRPLTEAQLTTPGGPDGWSVKDHLAHLAAWHRKQITAVSGRPDYEGLGIDEATYQAQETDGINAILHQRDQALSLPEVRAELEKTYRGLLTALQGLSDEEIAQYRQAIAANTYEHYEEHRPWIDDILATSRP
jgi:hypothetical protein